MKTKHWFKFLSLSIMLSLAVACGKDNSSGGGTSSANQNSDGSSSTDAYKAYSSISKSQLSVDLRYQPDADDHVRAFNNALKWRNSSTENGDIYYTGFTRGQIASNSSCDKEISLGFLGSICVSTSAPTVTYETTPTHFCTERTGNGNTIAYASVKSNTKPYDLYGCDLKNKVTYSKGKNAELNKIFSLNSGKWEVYAALSEGSLYTFILGEKGKGPSYLYQLDTSKHSVYAPERVGKIKVESNGWFYRLVLDGTLSRNEILK